ncbi:hypothetical protein MF4642_12765 [Acinetobacter sp. MF4642]|uniref:hypothetical protein n=1 Tax=Acinetobacter sp. MF4642 TaxID=1960825 RepID=UPI000994DBDC|nr:hypothetical protein [Acinetobacter sp. MF4642]OOW08742.1 hypothetical protein MF4642_12765 [Acinetobacter sp. MF4642]
MLSGQRASIFLKAMGARIKESQRIDATDKVRCYQIANSKSKVQIFFDAKTIGKCRFKFDYSTALNRVKINTISNIFQCYLDDEIALRNLVEYFEN